MIDLKQFYHKNVKLIDANGKEWIGYVEDYEYADENYEEKECIDLDVGDRGISFYIDEIKSIEEIN